MVVGCMMPVVFTVSAKAMHTTSACSPCTGYFMASCAMAAMPSQAMSPSLCLPPEEVQSACPYAP